MLTAWIAFNAFVLLFLALDLGVFHRKQTAPTLRSSLLWTLTWVVMALVFFAGLWIWHPRGGEASLEFLTGYLIEKSLSLDNIFVFVLIFAAFRVPQEHQHKVLFWGILGALVMRAIFIFAGVALLEKFHWLIYPFGAFLVYTGIRMAISHDDKIDPQNHPVIRFFRRFIPVTKDFVGSNFFTVENGKRMATPLFLVLLLVETTDLIFAVDSIPAILAVTSDPFLVYTANVFAILGLRSLYFALAGVMKLFRYLHYGLALVLVFVGIKMLLVDVYKLPGLLSLAVIVTTITTSIVLSILAAKREEKGLSK